MGLPEADAEEVDAVAAGDVAEAEAGFLPRFLGAVCVGAGSSCSDFLFLPGRDLGTRAGDTTCRERPHQQEALASRLSQQVMNHKLYFLHQHDR